VKYTHCILNKGLSSELPPPQSLRRGLVFGVGFGLFLVSIIIANNILQYFVNKYTNIYEISLLIWSTWGISYVVYLWISFFLIGFKKLPGCEFTAISHWLLKKNIHICVDSVLNSRLDKMQQEIGISPQLLKTESAQKWIAGFLLLLLLIYFLFIINLFVSLILIGLFSLIYFLYDITIHRFSIGRKDLTGKGDYPRLLLAFLLELKKGSLFKK
jgi:MFS family permease